MLTFNAHTQWSGDDSAIIAANSKRCSYTVTITPDEVVLHGRGVLEEFDREEDLPATSSLELLAILAIAKFEEGLE